MYAAQLAAQCRLLPARNRVLNELAEKGRFVACFARFVLFFCFFLLRSSRWPAVEPFVRMRKVAVLERVWRGRGGAGKGVCGHCWKAMSIVSHPGSVPTKRVFFALFYGQRSRAHEKTSGRVREGEMKRDEERERTKR